jgi:hypothetical protein
VSGGTTSSRTAASGPISRITHPEADRPVMAAAGPALATTREPDRIRRRQVAAQPHRTVRADGVGIGLGHRPGTCTSSHTAIA